MNLNDAFNPAPHVKAMINTGACLDIPTGYFIQGRRGEMILNAGLQPITGVTGIPNSFKSTVAEFMSLTGLARMGQRSTGIDYDTEANKHENHIRDIAMRIEEFLGVDPFGSQTDEPPRFVVTDKNEYTGDEWYALFKGIMEAKKKNANKFMVDTPFWDRKGQGPFKIMLPTFSIIDSFTAFETQDVIAMQDGNDLGESGANTLHMRQGLVKQRLLMEAPRLNNGNYNYMVMTAHLGKESTMQKGAGGKDVPVTKLTYLKNGDALKGVTGYFLSITQNLLFVSGVKALQQADGLGPEYPEDSSDKAKYDTDLNELTIRNLRGKAGASGMPIKLIVSQRLGVQPSLSEFHNCKENGRFGIEGVNTASNTQNYFMQLRPEVKLSRTTVRPKLNADRLLRRAVNITSEMQQMQYHWRDEEGLFCTPKELYDDLIAMGYDWNVLLDTRGWWTVTEAEPFFQPFLSVLDLLRMRKGLYVPYFLEADKKTVKAEYTGYRKYYAPVAVEAEKKAA